MNLANKMKGHTSVDLLAHALVPNINISNVLSSTSFRNFRMELNFSEELHSHSWFFSWASIKDRKLDYKCNWAWFFSMKLFNQNNIYVPQVTVSFWAVLLNNSFCLPISHPQLNWISDRKLEKLASRTWSLHAIVVFMLCMRFSEWKIWFSLWIDLIHRKCTIPSSPYSEPELASYKCAQTTSFWNAIFLFVFQL